VALEEVDEEDPFEGMCNVDVDVHEGMAVELCVCVCGYV
jgi:hypothetical protein